MKIEYLAPEMEVLEIKLNTNVLLSTSNHEGPEIGGVGDDEEAG